MNQLNEWYKRYPSIYFFVALIIKMILFRIFTFGEISMLSLMSDASAIVAVLAAIAVILANGPKRVAELIMALVVSTVLFAATIYYNYYGSLPTYRALENMKQVGQIGSSIGASFEPYMLLYFVDFIFLLLLSIAVHSSPNSYLFLQNKSERFRTRAIALLIFFLAIAGVSTSIWLTKDVENDHILSKRLGILNYQLAVAMEQRGTKAGLISPEKAAEMKREINEWLAESLDRAISETPLYFGAAKGKNLIVIQLEAFQNFVIGLSVLDQEITPNLNRLKSSSFYFPYFYQQIGEGNTSDAEFISNTSLYPLGSPAMSKLVAGKTVESLPRILSSYGYETMTMHVNDVSFWQRDELYPALGFDHYFDKPFFSDEKFNSFGASDQELYRVALEQFKKRQQQKQLFYAQLITVSSHHPYQIAEQFQKLTLPESLIGTQLGNYLQTIHYVDEQLGILIEQLKQEKLWDSSMLVLYGDHFGLQPKDNDAKWVGEQLGIQYDELISRFNIPFIIHIPDLKGETIEQVGGQIDIVPTIANLLGVSLAKEQLLAFGSDLLNTMTNMIGMRCYMPAGTLFNDDVMYVPGASFDTGYAINYRTLESVPLSNELQADYMYMLELLRLSDMFFGTIQTSVNNH